MFDLNYLFIHGSEYIYFHRSKLYSNKTCISNYNTYFIRAIVKLFYGYNFYKFTMMFFIRSKKVFFKCWLLENYLRSCFNGIIILSIFTNIHFLKTNLFSILKLHKNAMNGLRSNLYRTLIYKKYCLAAQYLHSENTTLRSISKSQLDSSIYIRIFSICWDNTV